MINVDVAHEKKDNTSQNNLWENLGCGLGCGVAESAELRSAIAPSLVGRWLGHRSLWLLFAGMLESLALIIIIIIIIIKSMSAYCC